MNNLSEGYQEICLGVSEGKFSKREIFFKHATIFDQFKIEKEKSKNIEWAKEHGLPTREQTVKDAISKGFWDESREKQLNLKIGDLNMFWSKRGKQDSLKAIRSFHQAINEMQEEIDADNAAKSVSLTQSREAYAATKGYDYEILLLARNEDNSPAFEEDDFYCLSDVEMNVLRNEYYNRVLRLDDDFFKKLAVAPFFYSLFDNCATNPSNFFGKPVCELTFFQNKLLEYGRLFNEVLKKCGGADADFYENPDWLVTLKMCRDSGKFNEDSGESFRSVHART